MNPAGAIHLLLDDGSLSISSTSDAAPLVRGWLPLGLVAASAPAAADIAVSVGTDPTTRDAPPTLRLLDVAAWVETDRAHFHHPSGSGGRLDLVARRGEVVLTPDAPDAVEPLLTLAAALLLGRIDRALVHAAAVVAPSGGVWLLIGDSHAGKSTTVATLALAGWRYLSDDQVVVEVRDDGVQVEGWRRTFNLDAGWEAGEVLGRRVGGVPVEGFGRGSWPVAGMLLPEVDAERPTALSHASAAEGFAALVRQSPWLLADQGVAREASRRLERVARLPVRRLALGRDSYRRPDRLTAALGALER